MMRSVVAWLLLPLVVVVQVVYCNHAIFELVRDEARSGEIEEFVKNDPAALNVVGPGGQTPLMAASLFGNAKAAKVLLDLGADVTIGERDGYTPMHGAGFQGRADVAKVLIEHGLDPNDFHQDGFTPFHRALWGREGRHTDTVRVFLEAGVDPELKTKRGEAPLALTKNMKSAQLLKEYIAQKNKMKDEL